MNWLHFLLWITGIYCLYYLLNIFFDLARSGRSPTGQNLSHELTFSEDVQPKVVEHGGDNEAGRKASLTDQPIGTDIISSGGVILKDLFGLARKEAIIYTRPVSF